MRLCSSGCSRTDPLVSAGLDKLIDPAFLRAAGPGSIGAAKTTGLDKVGEVERATRIAMAWLRSKLEPSPSDTDADSAPEPPHDEPMVAPTRSALGAC